MNKVLLFIVFLSTQVCSLWAGQDYPHAHTQMRDLTQDQLSLLEEALDLDWLEATLEQQAAFLPALIKRVSPQILERQKTRLDAYKMGKMPTQCPEDVTTFIAFTTFVSSGLLEAFVKESDTEGKLRPVSVEGPYSSGRVLLLDPSLKAHQKAISFFERYKKNNEKLRPFLKVEDNIIFSSEGDSIGFYLKDLQLYIDPEWMFPPSEWAFPFNTKDKTIISPVLQKTPEGSYCLRICYFPRKEGKIDVNNNYLRMAPGYVRKAGQQGLFSSYSMIFGCQHAEDVVAHKPYPILATDCGTPELKLQQAIFDFVEGLFKPMSDSVAEGRCSECIIAYPSSPIDAAATEINLLESILETYKATASIQEIEEAEKLIETKKEHLKAVFKQEASEWVAQTCSKLEEEWECRKQAVVGGTCGDLPKPKKKNQAKREKRAAVQKGLDLHIDDKLRSIQKEARGRFGAFLSGTQDYLKKAGVDALLFKTNNSGSHHAKLELTQNDQLLGRIILPGKDVGKGLIARITKEITEALKRTSSGARISK